MYGNKIQHACYIIAEIATLKIYSLIDNRVVYYFFFFFFLSLIFVVYKINLIYMIQQVNKFFIIPVMNFKHPLLFLTLCQSRFVRVTLLKSVMFLRDITHRRYVCHVCISALFASSLYSPTPRGDYRRGETFIKASTS